ncbi:MAG TPA: DinB family protein [Terriglobales bacterium]|nr:DinB family protein [Terriglobales bacterium]
MRNLVEHIVRVEQFFASRLLGQEPPEGKPQASGLAGFLQMHTDANGKFEAFLKASDDEKLHGTQMLGTRKVSNRKMLAQAALHSVHHWAQVAMEVRQAGFPTGKPQDFIVSDVME